MTELSYNDLQYAKSIALHALKRYENLEIPEHLQIHYIAGKYGKAESEVIADIEAKIPGKHGDG